MGQHSSLLGSWWLGCGRRTLRRENCGAVRRIFCLWASVALQEPQPAVLQVPVVAPSAWWMLPMVRKWLLGRRFMGDLNSSGKRQGQGDGLSVTFPSEAACLQPLPTSKQVPTKATPWHTLNMAPACSCSWQVVKRPLHFQRMSFTST